MGVIGKTVRKTLKAIGFTEGLKTTDSDRELLDQIRKHVQLDLDATDVQRALEADDRRFLNPATQWDDSDRKSRESAGRPCLTEDNIGPFLLQVTNEQRKNKPAVQVNPVDSDSDIDTAEVCQGLIRHIEYSSNADTAYDTAFWWAASCGRGFYRLCTDYVDSEGFEQEILIKRCPDPWLVFIDPAASESDFSDMKWGGFKAWISKDDFKDQYPDAAISNAGNSEWMGIGDDAPDWMNEDASALMVCEYFYKEFKKITIEKDGQKREAMKASVKWVKCTAVEILERGELPGELIPIVAVLGKEIIQDGQRTWSGLIRAGKDPQKRLNYMLTSQVERIAFMPLATWIGAKGFMGKSSKLWQNAHKNQVAALEFEVIGDEGQGINAPRLITEEAPIVAVTNAMEGSKQGIKAVLGMYDANMGQRQGGESGVAIQRLQSQGETGTYHLQDNLARAIRYEGRIILSWLGTVYDTERVIRIIGEDDTQKQVRINGPVQNDQEAIKREHVGKTFDLTLGRYDVTISAGPSYQSKRQEDRAMLLGMLSGPMGQLIAQRAGDLVAKTLDSPIARELSERLIPPDIKQAEQGPQGGQIPPQVQQQMMGMKQQADALAQQHEAMTQKIHELMDEIQSQQAKVQADLQKAQLDAQTKLEIARMNNETELIKVQAQINAQKADEELNQQLATLQQEHQELQQLALHMHDAMQAGPVNPPEPEPDPQDAQEPQEPAEPKIDPMHKLMEGHTGALNAIAEALKRSGGAKRIVTDPQTGAPVGMEPVEEGQ